MSNCTCVEQTSEADLLARLDEAIAERRQLPGALIPVLQIAQGLFGYLPETALKRICQGLGLSYSEVAGRGRLLQFLLHHATGPPHHPRLSRHGLLRARQQTRAGSVQTVPGSRRRPRRRPTGSSPSKWRAASAPAASRRPAWWTTPCTRASKPNDIPAILHKYE